MNVVLDAYAQLSKYNILILSLSDIILSCYLLCSILSCLNRVVGRGFQFQLHLIQRKAQCDSNNNGIQSPPPLKTARLDTTIQVMSDNHHNINDMEPREWALVALEDIPIGAFICEWTGQYVLGG